VRMRPSDTRRSYPVDIAVFTSDRHTEDSIFIIVECKKKTRNDGKSQLQDYLRFSKAQLGVWFNGRERLFLRKIERAGRIEFEEIPNIPKFGQSIDEIGALQRKDLTHTHNLKSIFRAIRNHLAANAVGTTRDEILAQQLINLIFCKIFDEKFKRPTDIVDFRVGINEEYVNVEKRIKNLFKEVKTRYNEVFDDNDEIKLDAKSIVYVIGELQNYCLLETKRDVIADAFETFIGPSLKGAQGQFFTPRNVVKMMVDILDPDEKDLIIDPACGSGGFLIEALRYIWGKLEIEAKEFGWSEESLKEEKIETALRNIRGIEKDSFLAKVAKAYMAIIGDGKSGIFCEDSLENPKNWNMKTQQKIQLGKFTVLFTNPPFGSKIPVKGEEKLKQFDLGYKWKKNKETGKWEITNILKDKEAPQILFIERCLQFLDYGGRMAIVLPDGIYGNESLSYIRQWLLGQGRIIGIIDVPIETFMPNTSTKTSILIFQKLKKEDIPDDYLIFMAVAETCGHDRRGKALDDDDIMKMAEEFKKWAYEHDIKFKER
ncbi:MAG: restriction endonuclease subunit M, partial [Promethearchaeia archaeon]